MDKNRLQLELERLRATSPSELIDLADTSFHANGFRFPDDDLRALIADYLRRREYRPDPKGDPAARHAISAYYARSSMAVDPERIFITASTSESYSLLFASLADAGDNVVLPRPSYPLFEYLAGFARLEARYYDMDFERCYRIDAASVADQIDERTRFVVLISPNNPTGRVAAVDEVDALLEICERRGTTIIADEVFSEFLYPTGAGAAGRPLPRPAARSRGVPVFTLNGVSKMFAGPDLKLAWIAVTGDYPRLEETLDRLETANDTFLNCSSLAQGILPGLFDRGGSFSREMVDELAARRLQLLRSLAVPVSRGHGCRPLIGNRGLRLVPPDGGIHAVVGIPRADGATWRDDEDFAVSLLRERGIYVHPGYFYSIEETEREIYVVVSFLKKRELLAEGLSRLVSCL